MYGILLPVGTDEDRARKQASFVAGLPAAAESISVVVTHAFESEGDDTPTAMQRPDRVGAVRTAVDLLEDAGIEASVREAGAPAADGIVDLAAELDVDQIVISGRRVNPVGKAVFGSVAQDVIIDADCPVTLIGAEE